MFKKYEEIIRYLVVGVMTTVISVIAYWLFARWVHISYMMSTVLSWIVSVLFAFIMNKCFVFQRKSWNFLQVVKESVDFVLCRIMTLFIEMVMMWFFVDLIVFDDMISKIIVQVVVIVLNYIFSKLFVFR